MSGETVPTETTTIEARILSEHDLKHDLRRVPNGRPVSDWSCTCGLTFAPPLSAQYLLHLIEESRSPALPSRDALIASIEAARFGLPVSSEAIADRIIADAGVAE